MVGLAGLDLHFAFGKIIVATSVCTGSSNSPPDCCIWMGSSPAPCKREKKKAIPIGMPFSFLARRTEKDIYLIFEYNISKKAQFSLTILFGKIKVKKSLHLRRHKPKTVFLRLIESYSNSKSV